MALWRSSSSQSAIIWEIQDSLRRVFGFYTSNDSCLVSSILFRATFHWDINFMRHIACRASIILLRLYSALRLNLDDVLTQRDPARDPALALEHMTFTIVISPFVRIRCALTSK